MAIPRICGSIPVVNALRSASWGPVVKEGMFPKAFKTARVAHALFTTYEAYSGAVPLRNSRTPYLVSKETGKIAVILSGGCGGIAGRRYPFEKEDEGMQRLERGKRFGIKRI
jgi:hypothetical protein